MTGKPWGGHEPRAWQPKAIQAVLSAWRSGERAPLIHACTGAGKSHVIAEVAALGKGRCLVTTPTQDLVRQLSQTLNQRLPGQVGRAFQYAWETDRRVIVTCNASLPRLLEEQREWGCWIADEAHRLEGPGLREATKAIERKVAMGMTATPFRGDKLGLETWGTLAFSYTSGQAVSDGVLVPSRAVRVDPDSDLTLDVDEVCLRWARDAVGPGIISAVTVADAEKFSAFLVSNGVPAEAISQKNNSADRELKIRRLKSGTIKVLVHVQLLTEGIDLPWLQWIALRRPVASPVRLVQEVGRVLRAAPGKTEAVIYDPHDLLRELGLSHSAALEDAQREEGTHKEGEDPWFIPELDGLDEVSRLPHPKAVHCVEGWVGDLLGMLRMHGIAQPPDPQYAGGKWRVKRATEKQLKALGRMSWASRMLPDERHRRAVKWVLEQPSIRSGTAGDLLTSLHALAGWAEELRTKKEKFYLPFSVPGIELKEQG